MNKDMLCKLVREYLIHSITLNKQYACGNITSANRCSAINGSFIKVYFSIIIVS